MKLVIFLAWLLATVVVAVPNPGSVGSQSPRSELKFQPRCKRERDVCFFDFECCTNRCYSGRTWPFLRRGVCSPASTTSARPTVAPTTTTKRSSTSVTPTSSKTTGFSSTGCTGSVTSTEVYVYTASTYTYRGITSTSYGAFYQTVSTVVPCDSSSPTIHPHPTSVTPPSMTTPTSKSVSVSLTLTSPPPTVTPGPPASFSCDLAYITYVPISEATYYSNYRGVTFSTNIYTYYSASTVIGCGSGPGPTTVAPPFSPSPTSTVYPDTHSSPASTSPKTCTTLIPIAQTSTYAYRGITFTSVNSANYYSTVTVPCATTTKLATTTTPCTPSYGYYTNTITGISLSGSSRIPFTSTQTYTAIYDPPCAFGH